MFQKTIGYHLSRHSTGLLLHRRHTRHRQGWCWTPAAPAPGTWMPGEIRTAPQAEQMWVHEGICGVPSLQNWCPGCSHTTIQGKAIAHVPPPQEPQQLRSFLGLVNYYGKFIPNLATLVNPLNKLLHKDAPWKWDVACQAAFSSAQEALTSSPVVIH